MKIKKIFIFLVSLLCFSTVSAQYSQRASVFSAGGDKSANATYTNYSCFGQYSASTSVNSYTNTEGFMNSQMFTKPIQTSNLRFANVTRSSITLLWDNGNGDRRAVFVKSSRFGSTPLTNNVQYTGNAIFGRGSMVDKGAYCIYNGIGTSVNVTGLDRYMLYYFRAFEYNNKLAGEFKYLQTTNPTNPVSRYTLRKEGDEYGDFAESPMEIYPNPAKDELNYSISLAESANVSAELIDQAGRTVKSITHGLLNAGNQTLQSNISDLSSGVYLLSIKIGEDQMIGIIEVVK